MVGLSPEVMRNFDTFVGSIPASSMETVGYDVNRGINAIATGDADALGHGWKIWE
jgi:hypothetical protein